MTRVVVPTLLPLRTDRNRRSADQGALGRCPKVQCLDIDSRQSSRSALPRLSSGIGCPRTAICSGHGVAARDPEEIDRNPCLSSHAGMVSRARGAGMPSKGLRLKQMQELHRAQNFDRMMSYLAVHPCVDCGEQDLIVLDFDHLPEHEKHFEVSRAVTASTRSWQSIEREIAKCEVVCANCHRRRTARRGNHRKHRHAIGESVGTKTVPDPNRRIPHGGGAKGRYECDCSL